MRVCKRGNFYRKPAKCSRRFHIPSRKRHRVHEPHFSFQGFRYICMKLSGEILPERLRRVILPIGETGFECSNELIISFSIISWGQKGISGCTDGLPSKNQRWLDRDAQMFIRTACSYETRLPSIQMVRDLLRNVSGKRRPICGAHVLDEKSFSSSAGDAANHWPWTLYYAWNKDTGTQIIMKLGEYLTQGENPYL